MEIWIQKILGGPRMWCVLFSLLRGLWPIQNWASDSQNPSLVPTANLALPGETRNPCLASISHWECSRGLQEGSRRNSGWRWADNEPKTPPQSSASFSIPGPPTWALGHQETSRAHTSPNLPRFQIRSFPSSAMSLLGTKAIVLSGLSVHPCPPSPSLQSLPLPCNPWEGRILIWLLLANFSTPTWKSHALTHGLCTGLSPTEWTPSSCPRCVLCAGGWDVGGRGIFFLNTHLELQTFLWESSSIS